MREILFRGKAINRDPEGTYRTNYRNGDWVYGLVTNYYDDRFPNVPLEMTNESGVSGIDVDHETVGQWTGLVDKNGIKIFEGDILQGDEYPYCCDGSLNYFAEVVWFEECCAFGITTWKNPNSSVRGISDGMSDYMEDFESSRWLIIGNIYDNPELIDGSEEDG